MIKESEQPSQRTPGVVGTEAAGHATLARLSGLRDFAEGDELLALLRSSGNPVRRPEGCC